MKNFAICTRIWEYNDAQSHSFTEAIVNTYLQYIFDTQQSFLAMKSK